MQAILVKARKSELITKHQSDYLWKQLSASGYRKKEAIEIPREQPTIFRDILATHLDDFKYSMDDLSKILFFNKVNECYFNKTNRLKILRNSA